jgi:hypothetical protein
MAQLEKDGQRTPSATQLKNIGNALYGQKRYTEALSMYTRAIAAPEGHRTKELWGNRSVVNLSLGNFEDALADALRCRNIDRLWPKAYLRVATACAALVMPCEGIAACLVGYAVLAKATTVDEEHRKMSRALCRVEAELQVQLERSLFADVFTESENESENDSSSECCEAQGTSDVILDNDGRHTSSCGDSREGSPSQSTTEHGIRSDENSLSEPVVEACGSSIKRILGDDSDNSDFEAPEISSPRGDAKVVTLDSIGELRAIQEHPCWRYGKRKPILRTKNNSPISSYHSLPPAFFL